MQGREVPGDETPHRLAAALVMIAMLTAPLAYSVSTRPVHEAYVDAFVPEKTNEPAQIVDSAIVNCGDDAIEGQSAPTHVTSHTNPHEGGDDNQLRGGESASKDSNFNSGMACWHLDGEPSPEHNLWTDEEGKILSGSPPFYTCKRADVDLELGIQNPFPMYVPDPTVDDDARFGAYEDEDAFAEHHAVLVASGSFYVIPTLSGDDVENVEAIWFSYFETTPTAPVAGMGGGSDETCASLDRHAATTSGAYYEFFRGDIDKSDGWTIAINTLLVPDNVYGAKLTLLGHMDEAGEAGVDEGDIGEPYPGGLEILAMGYAYAITDNTEDDTTWSSCTPSREACDNQDTTPPWPQVVPGDVPLDDAQEKDKVIVTFGEHVNKDATDISIDGNSQGEDPVGHDQAGVDAIALMNQDLDYWGERYEFPYEGLEDCTEITVSAQDLHGNQATKTVFAGGPGFDADEAGC